MAEYDTLMDKAETIHAAFQLIAKQVAVSPERKVEITEAVPDIVRHAAKAIANQPELWCQGAIHRYDNGVIFDEEDAHRSRITQSCAMGHIENEVYRAGILEKPPAEDNGVNLLANDAVWRVICDPIQAASQEIAGKTVAAFNDHETATPETVADHLMAVADTIEFP